MTPKESNTVCQDPQLALAQRLYRENYARCFWHMKPDLEVTRAFVPLVIDGLRHHGGKAGMLAAEQLAREP